jgi:hypothetical protein
LGVNGITHKPSYAQSITIIITIITMPTIWAAKPNSSGSGRHSSQ